MIQPRADSFPKSRKRSSGYWLARYHPQQDEDLQDGPTRGLNGDPTRYQGRRHDSMHWLARATVREDVRRSGWSLEMVAPALTRSSHGGFAGIFVALYIVEKSLDDVVLLDLRGRIRLGDETAALRKTVDDILSSGRRQIILSLEGVD